MSNITPSPRTVLFTDLRHIRCGDLEWFGPGGDLLPVVRPPEPEVTAHAQLGYLPRGIRLAAQPATKTEPWQQGPPSGRVIYDGGVYRSWGIVAEVPPNADARTYYTTPPTSVSIRYAESQDGFAWKTVADSPLATPNLTGFDGPTFFIDPHAPAAERYKFVYSARPAESQRAALWQAYQKVHPRYRDGRIAETNLHCLYAAVSPDGIQWQQLPDPLLIHQSDTDTCVYWDEWLQRYVLYTRLYWQERRSIGRAETADFRHWPLAEPMVWPDLAWSLSSDIYLNARSSYPDLPDVHLMFPMIYHRFTQASEVHLYSSADGICWFHVPGAVITPGAAGSWDSEFIYTGKDLVPFGPNRIGLPYFGTPYPHKYPRWPSVLQSHRGGWAWWPQGRLCAVTADEEGEFFTFPLVPAGRALRLNVRTWRGGEVRVEVFQALRLTDDRFHIRELYHQRQQIAGRTLADCAPITGDSLAFPVHWQGQTDIGVGEGEAVTLHFTLRAAEIFGFEWV